MIGPQVSDQADSRRRDDAVSASCHYSSAAREMRHSICETAPNPLSNGNLVPPATAFHAPDTNPSSVCFGDHDRTGRFSRACGRAVHSKLLGRAGAATETRPIRRRAPALPDDDRFSPLQLLDGQGRLSGFHVDLAREVCRELDIVARCQIQGLPWDELDTAMATGQGEALIAGTPINAQTRESYLFSRPYLRFPARFVVRKSTTLYEPLYKAIDGKRTGVMAGTAHEAMLRRYFPDAKAVTFTKPEWLQDALREGRIDGIFGDGMRLSFWLAGSASQNCCRFAGGPYLAPEFLGSGLAIAVKRDDAVLARAFDFALREISVNGTFAELYLKYFPVSFY
ncbi:transporter substrate-binding domain-containing protein [Neoaquamicrobium sediminum]|uniref:transporter substrate-binding domain-containing protein n=1 Tax=Neoaquamicrobium sediminum TaxID=1849104 RepID=UPI0028AD1C61|nr:transporter substrate-binding domain-containing protein [Mesorhizobium sediminum]